MLESAAEALTGLTALVPTHEVDAAVCIRIALDLGIGVYDSAYLLLSRAIGRSLITADRRQFDVGVRAGYDVLWLGDLPPA